jgi:hypothetical protein
MKLDRSHPEILSPPGHPPACCTQQTITVGPQIAAKTRQKHDYPSPAWRRSYARRTNSERTFATIKDPATTSTARGWYRLTGLTPLALWLACLLTVRNQRILTAWDTRQADTARRAAAGLPPAPASTAGAPRPPAAPPGRHSQTPRPRRSAPPRRSPQPPHTHARPHNPSQPHNSQNPAEHNNPPRSATPGHAHDRNVRHKCEHASW